MSIMAIFFCYPLSGWLAYSMQSAWIWKSSSIFALSFSNILGGVCQSDLEVFISLMTWDPAGVVDPGPLFWF